MKHLFKVFSIGLFAISSAAIAQTAHTISVSSSKVCRGEQVQLSVSGCTSGIVLWNNGTKGTMITETITQNTNYQATCMEGEKVMFTSSSITILALDVPTTPYMLCNDDEISVGENTTVGVFGCVGTVVWNNGVKTKSQIVSPISTTTYTAVCQNDAGCSSTPISRTVIVNDPSKPSPAPQISTRYGCKGESVLMKANGCSSGVYVWYKNTLSNGTVIRSEEIAKGNSVEVSEGGSTIYYTAKCFFQECLGDESNRIELNYITSISAPTVKKLYLADSTSSVNLADAIVGKTLTSGGIFEYHQNNTASSALINTPNAIKTTGEYYVLEKSREGNCVSAASKIIVEKGVAPQNTVNVNDSPIILVSNQNSTNTQIPFTVQSTDVGAVIASTEPNADMSDIAIPEGFSPNNDGVNDKFEIKNLGDKKALIRIYNRYGHLIYSADEYKNDWDGKASISAAFKPHLGVPDGIYYYMIKLSDGRQKISFITIAR